MAESQPARALERPAPAEANSPHALWMSVSPGQVQRPLFALVGALALAHLVVSSIRTTTGHDHLLGLMNLFDLDGEGNLPAMVSSLLLLAGATLCAIAGAAMRTRPGGARPWLVLAGVFAFLSVDEFAMLHERLSLLVRHGGTEAGLRGVAWLAPYGLATLALAWSFLPAWRQCGAATRRRFVAAAALYLTGAAALEIVAAFHPPAAGRAPGFAYDLLVMFQETLELAGCVTFIGAMVGLLAESSARVRLEFRHRDGTPNEMEAPIAVDRAA